MAVVEGVQGILQVGVGRDVEMQIVGSAVAVAGFKDGTGQREERTSAVLWYYTGSTSYG